VGQRPRPRPEHLPAKLLKIRYKLGMSQDTLAKALAVKVTSHRISEYETGAKEPNLLVLLRYARLAKVSVDVLIDDEAELNF
jgi:transcriptional regulator with XRE-family HTH domain